MSIRPSLSVLGAAAVLFLCAVDLPAQKKGGGGGGGSSAPPPDPAIAFVDTGRIRVMNADGSNVRTVVAIQQGEGAQFPCWSPDGQQLAFCATLGGQRGIWRVNLDGSGLQFLAPQAGIVPSRPDWSRVPTPDGHRKILFTSDDASGRADLFVVNPDGTGLQNLTNSPGISENDGCWTRDAAGICCGAYDDSSQPPYRTNVLTVGQAAGGGLEVTASAAMLAGFSVLGCQMAHGADLLMAYGGPVPGSPHYAIWAIDITALPWTPYLVHGDQEVQFAPSFSPDDTRIVERRQGNGPNAGIFTANPDGTGLVRIYGSGGFMPSWRHN